MPWSLGDFLGESAEEQNDEGSLIPTIGDPHPYRVHTMGGDPYDSNDQWRYDPNKSKEENDTSKWEHVARDRAKGVPGSR